MAYVAAQEISSAAHVEAERLALSRHDRVGREAEPSRMQALAELPNPAESFLNAISVREVNVVHGGAVAEPDESLAAGGDLRIMSRDDDRHATVLTEAGEQVQDIARVLRVEIPGRLVGKQRARRARPARCLRLPRVPWPPAPPGQRGRARHADAVLRQRQGQQPAQQARRQADHR